MKLYLLLITALCAAFMVSAQDVSICASDTVVLGLNNYNNGSVQWQESLDNESWVELDGCTQEILTLMPTETKYYRAEIITTECDPLYSEVSLVQLAPDAYAGTDREIGGNSTGLLGSYEVGATGKWEIIQGTGGVIATETDPYSEFSGEYGQNYLLTWTLTNGCAQSTDTLSVVFEEIIAKSNFIVVDETDVILSDSTDLANGIYKIRFSDDSIVPNDTMLLVGMRRDVSFLENIVSYYYDNGTYVISTTPGNIEEIITSGPMNIGDAANQSMAINGNAKKSANMFPTRATLEQYKNSKTQKLIYSSRFYSKNDLDSYIMSSTKSASAETVVKGMKLEVPDMQVFATEGGELTVDIEDTYLRFEPNFVADIKVDLLKGTSVKIGLDNAEFEYNYKLIVAATAAKEFSKEVEIFEISNNLVFMVGPVPVLISLGIGMNAEASISASAQLTVTQEKNYLKKFTAILQGDKIKDIKFYSKSTTKKTSSTNYDIQGRLGAEFSIGPEISLELYKIVGPYFALPLTLSSEICVNKNLNWLAESSLGIEGNFGVKAHLGKIKLFDIEKTLFSLTLGKPLTMPYMISVKSGKNQRGFKNQLLDKPIDLKVYSSTGFGVPLVPVRLSLDEGNGSVSEIVRFTDWDGEVSIDDWQLGDNADARIDMSVLNCDDEDIEKNSPFSVYAYATFDCANTNIAIGIDKSSEGINPVVTGGLEPYTYSLDGVNYSKAVMSFPYANEGNFSLFVKDSNQCNANRAITVVAPDPCLTNPLFIDLLGAANTMQVSGISGTAPYLFALDDIASLSGNYIYSNITPGAHLAYVMDANNCLVSEKFDVDDVSTMPIRSVDPLDEAVAYGVNDITFNWQAAVFAENQTYDLYLKEGENDYERIAQNMSDETYTHNTALNYTTNYTWKIEVKNESAKVMEEAEFNFTTMGDPSILPLSPVIISPADSSLVDTLIVLKWESQGADIKYDVYLDGSLKAYSILCDSAIINNLTPSTPYTWKVMAKKPNSTVTAESASRTFDTKALLPTLTTKLTTNILDTSAMLNGELISEGLSPVTQYGFCMDTLINPSVELNMFVVISDTGSFSATISSLDSETLYYYRAYAKNINGIAYGNQEEFTTLRAGVSDIDGNYYPIVTIGDQTWMAQNLAVTMYADSTPISIKIDNGNWGSLEDNNTDKAYCWYNNDIGYKESYGALYTYAAATNGDDSGSNVQGACPTGWHLPSNEEWTVLEDYISADGHSGTEGTALKAISGWDSGNGNDNYGFAGLPGGFRRNSDGSFDDIGSYGHWWCSTSSYYRDLRSIANTIYSRSYHKSSGFSVRCVKNE